MKEIKDIVLEGVEKHLGIKNPKLDTLIPGETLMKDIEMIRGDVESVYGKMFIMNGRPKLANISETPEGMINFFTRELKKMNEEKEEHNEK